jgi:hypothetical protein
VVWETGSGRRKASTGSIFAGFVERFTVTGAEWLRSTDPDAMLTVLGDGPSERKKRLFACACCRRVLSRIPDDRVRAALEVSEAFADRAATGEQLAAAYSVAWEVYEAAMSSDEPGEPFADAVGQACCEKLGDVAEIAEEARLDPTLYDDPSPADRRFTRRERKAQAGLIRDLFGNPFRPVALDKPWRQAEVIALARAAYDERQLPGGELDPHRLAVLADALEEAGAPDELVAHLRSPGPHVRGCWAVDLCLGIP